MSAAHFVGAGIEKPDSDRKHLSQHPDPNTPAMIFNSYFALRAIWGAFTLRNLPRVGWHFPLPASTPRDTY